MQLGRAIGGRVALMTDIPKTLVQEETKGL